VNGAPAPDLLECLETVLRLVQEGATPSITTLARRLGIGRSVVTERALALQGLGLLQSAPDGTVALTPPGQRLAVGQIRKHRLLERFLSDLLALSWDRAHEEASRLTPVLSDDVADGLARLLGSPRTCPHGNPIPTADGSLVPAPAVPLHKLRPGHSGIIERVEREEPELLKYLAALGLLPDRTVEVEEIAPLGGPVLVKVNGARYALGRKVAAHVLVREV
jgi:DtxR family Mn-dependent transcriptional regulator